MEKDKEEILREILIKNHKRVGNCIEWTGKTNQGYGYIYIFKKTISIHRLSYILEKGPIPKGFSVLHICDNKKCFNPKHLYSGTAKENRQDFLCSNDYENFLEKKYQTKKEIALYKNEHLPPQEFLTIEETASIFKVHPNTIRKAIRDGYIIALRIGNGPKSPYRISKKSVELIHHSILKKMNEMSLKK